MQYVVLAIMALIAAIVIGKAMVHRSPGAFSNTLRIAGGIVLCGLAALLALSGPGRMILAIPLGAVGLMLLLNRPPPGTRPVGGPGDSFSGGQQSTVRTAWIEMILDHETGKMSGQVLSGALAGRTLNSLNEAEALELLHEASGDPQSVQLLEAFLDRRFDGWRARNSWDDMSAANDAGGPMTREEALNILGLDENASPDDIRAAHRELMKKVHPDQGGSTYLATKINAAKDTLLEA